MKKIIIILLAVFLPVCAVADSICGVWPFYLEKKETLPTIWDSLGFSCENILAIIDFRETGEVFLYEILFSDGMGEPGAEILGEWKKENERYTIRLIGSQRTISAYMEDDNLWIALFDPECYFMLSRFNSFDWYNSFRIEK